MAEQHHPTTMKKLGYLIKSQRLKTAYSQERLGKVLNVGISSINRWECGTSFPHESNLKTIIRVLDITPQMLEPCFEHDQEYWNKLMKDDTFKLMMERRKSEEEKTHYNAYERHAPLRTTSSLIIPIKQDPIELKPEEITPEQARQIFNTMKVKQVEMPKPIKSPAPILKLCKEVKILDMNGQVCCYHINTGDGSVELKDNENSISLVHGQLDKTTLATMISELQEVQKILTGG